MNLYETHGKMHTIVITQIKLHYIGTKIRVTEAMGGVTGVFMLVLIENPGIASRKNIWPLY
jgi:aspartate 1-decarboxylase